MRIAEGGERSRAARRLSRTEETRHRTRGDVDFLSGVASSLCVLHFETQSSEQQQYRWETRMLGATEQTQP